jgi:peptidyl-prolyl cis-trans isomerase C
MRQARLELAAGALYQKVAAAVDVSPLALRQAYDADPGRFRRPPVLRVQEILADDLDLADSLATLIRGGADMAALASRYTRRVWAAPKGGDLGDIAEGMPAYSRMAAVLRDAPVGQLVGPIPSHGGYSVLRVTSRQEQEVVPFEDARPMVAGFLRDRAMDAYIDSLQEAHADRIEVDERALGRTLGGATP